jgi:cytochrome c-type biogenesis protein CcmH
MNAALLLGIVLLLVAALGLMLWPLRRKDDAVPVSRNQLNAAIYRDQLNELERDRAAATLDQAGFEQSTRELQRLALKNATELEPFALPQSEPSQQRLVVSLAVLLPVAAVALYAWLGNPAATVPQPQQPEISSEQINGMVEKLAARLQKNPDDLQGWAMLGRSYKVLGRFDDAEKAFSHLGDALQHDSGLLADYAEVLARRADGDFDGSPQVALDKALELDPDNMQALALAGVAQYQRQNYAGAIAYWEKLKAKLPPESEQAKSVQVTIDKAQVLAAQNPKAPGAAKNPQMAKADAAKPSTTSNANTQLSGRVTLAPALAAQVRPTDTLFVFARAASGPRIPLAVLRTTAGKLPLDFTLDDSLAMNPQFKLSLLPAGAQVTVGAHISKTGEAFQKAGDFIGAAGPVNLGTKGILIAIERVVPEAK